MMFNPANFVNPHSIQLIQPKKECLRPRLNNRRDSNCSRKAETSAVSLMRFCSTRFRHCWSVELRRAGGGGLSDDRCRRRSSRSLSFAALGGVSTGDGEVSLYWESGASTNSAFSSSSSSMSSSCDSDIGLSTLIGASSFLPDDLPSRDCPLSFEPSYFGASCSCMLAPIVSSGLLLELLGTLLLI